MTPFLKNHIKKAMDFSKKNVVSRHFSKKMIGGLDEFEVRDFLHVLSEEIRHLSELVKKQEQKILNQQKFIEEYKDREHLLKESIASASEIASGIKKEAQKQGQLIVEKAQMQSENLVSNARSSLQSVYSDIADLKKLHLQFKTSLKASLQAQLELIEQAPLLSSREEEPAQISQEEASQKNTTLLEKPFHQDFDAQALQSENHKQEEVFFDNLSETEKPKEPESFSFQAEEELDLHPSKALQEEESLSKLQESLKSLDKDF